MKKQNLQSVFTEMKQEQFSEFKLRVPKNLVKKYNVMSINAPRPVKFEEVKEANMVRKTKKQIYADEDTLTTPKYGAGSVYNMEQKEEARRKKYGQVQKTINTDDLPYALRLGGKGGKRYTGRKEITMLEHSAYFIFTQCPDGVFEAIPVQGWYNFTSDINYATLTADEVEMEFTRRSKNISYVNNKYNFKSGITEEEGNKVKDQDGSLIIHDDIDKDDDNEETMDFDNEDVEKSTKKNVKTKNLFHGKKKESKDGDDSTENDSDEEEEVDKMESKEVDYMSESSSEDELNLMDDDPEPEKGAEMQAKDDLNAFEDESESDNDTELNDAGKELKALIKKEAGEEDASSGDDDEEDDDDDDDDIDEEKYSKSALFLQGTDGKKKKSSKPVSRSNTPIPVRTDDILSQAADKLSEAKAGTKRPNSRVGIADSPTNKKSKILVEATGSLTEHQKRRSPSSPRSGTPTVDESGVIINEESIRKLLLHKPMTATDLVRKFKTKKTGLTKEQMLKSIATVVKKIGPHQEKRDGKLFFSIKSRHLGK